MTGTLIFSLVLERILSDCRKEIGNLDSERANEFPVRAVVSSPHCRDKVLLIFLAQRVDLDSVSIL